MADTNCTLYTQDRRLPFWATTVDGCGSEASCGGTCGDPGIPILREAGQATLATEGFLTSLAINILLTNGRKPDTACGYTPGAQGGHWSESFIAGGGGTVGGLLRNIPPAGRVTELSALLSAYAKAALERMIDYGVARAIHVDTTYLGNGRFGVDAEITAISGNVAHVALSTTRSNNSFIWST